MSEWMVYLSHAITYEESLKTPNFPPSHANVALKISMYLPVFYPFSFGAKKTLLAHTTGIGKAQRTFNPAEIV